MDQRTNFFNSDTVMRTLNLVLLNIAITGQIFAQSTITEKYRYNDANIVLTDSTERSVLLMNIKNDSLLVLQDKSQIWYSYQNLKSVSVQHYTRSTGAGWMGFFSAIWLGNLLFYQSGSGMEYNEPTGLMTTDYPEGFGAIAINALFGTVGFILTQAFSPDLSESKYNLTNGQNEKYDDWQIFKSEMQGSSLIRRNRFRLQIRTGSLTNKVLDTYQKYFPDRNSYSYYFASDFNILRRIQLNYSLKNKIQIGLAFVNQGEPTISGPSPDGDFPSQWVQVKYDAVGYYLTLGYAVDPFQNSKVFELLAGGGIGYLRSNLAFQDAGFPINSPIYELKDKYLGTMLYAELMIYLADYFSLSVNFDYCASSVQTIPAIEQLNIPEETVTLGNSSFGFGIAYHF